MSIKIERVASGGALVTVAATLDYPATEELAGALEELLDEGVRSLVIDLSQAAPVDDAAIGVLFEALRAVRPLGGGVALVVTDPALRGALTVMGLERTFRVRETLAAARSAVGAGAPDEP
jgi:anti-anti-sigma factor